MSVGTVRREIPSPFLSVQSRRSWGVLAFGTAIPVAALTLLAAVLRFALIGHQGFWFDEANTALLVHFSPGKMLGLIPQTESTPPLYYCIAWLWARVFGYSEVGLRSLSALAGVTTVPVAFGAGVKLISRRAGLIAAALTACNPLLIWYSQEARSYSLLMLLSACTLLGFAYVLDSPTRRALTGWVIACALALATHYYALLAIVPQALWLLFVRRRERGVQVAVGLVGLCGAALIPLAISQSASGHTAWISTQPLLRRLGQVIPQFVDGFPSPGQGVIEPIAIGLTAVAVLLLLLRSDPRERGGAVIAAAFAVGGLMLNLLVIAAGTDDLITRNVLALWMPAALVVAGGLAAPRARLTGIVLTVALCGLCVASTVGIAADRDFQRPDWRGVARIIGARPEPGSPGRAILIQHYRYLLPLSLYMPGLRSMPKPGAQVTELDLVSFSSPASGGFCWWGAACNLWGSELQGSYRVAGFRELWIRREYQFTVMRLVSDRPVLLTRSAVSKALKKTKLRNDELLLQR